MPASIVVAKARSGTVAACSQSSSNIVRLRGACICYLEMDRKRRNDDNNSGHAASTCGWILPLRPAYVQTGERSDASCEGGCPARRADNDRQSAEAQRPIARGD